MPHAARALALWLRRRPYDVLQIKPAIADAKIIAGDPADHDMMVKKGYSFYVEGSATKDSGGKTIKKTFHWGFTIGTQYADCHHEEDGKDTAGLVVTNGSTDTTELTTHGDHLYYDRLQASPDPEIKTSLRFDEKAAADDAPNGNADREITLEEMFKLPIDVTKCDPSGLKAPTIGDFVTSLARTIGHFRGEGECTNLEDRVIVRAALRGGSSRGTTETPRAPVRGSRRSCSGAARGPRAAHSGSERYSSVKAKPWPIFVALASA
ncbi:MAG: hypothetical protein V9G22_15740 [Ottowia sp.]